MIHTLDQIFKLLNFKFLEVSILNTVERITAFAAIVFFGALLISIASYFILTTIQQQQLKEYNTPFVLDKYPSFNAN